jgi:glucokinase
VTTAPVLEVGGTHVTAALVTWTATGPTVERVRRTPLPADGGAEEIVSRLVHAAGLLRAPGHAIWGVAVPGPFDYARGIGLFRGVGKFDALYGVDLRRKLLERVEPPALDIRFLNDADAFAIGEWTAGAARGHDRVLGLTLGTGIGSCFLDRGRPVHDGPEVPPDGYAYRLTIAGRPLEETVSRHAILAHHRRLHPAAAADLDVHDLARLAREHDPAAMRALTEPLTALGRALAPWITRFGATVVVVGGSMAESWDLVGPPLTEAAQSPHRAVAVVPAAHLEHAALVGAAAHAACAEPASD